MEKVEYSKDPLAITKQISLLKDRGMIIHDEAKVAEFLSFNNYYKFAGYWKKFADSKTHNITHTEKNFDFFQKLYLNDKELSHIISKYISVFEDVLRTQYAYNFSIQTQTSHPHLNQDNFKENTYTGLKTVLTDCFDRSHHRFKTHYKNQYTEELPPIWVLVEILPLGTLINLIDKTKAEKISSFTVIFNYKSKLLDSFLHSLYFVRNLCAHNSILWNIEYEKYPKIPNDNKNAILNKINTSTLKTISNFLLILVYLLEQIGLQTNIRVELNTFFNSIEEKYLEGYGIDLSNKNIFIK